MRRDDPASQVTRYVALLKGVNVGGKNRLVMADWRVALSALGYSDVRTLLNSGNAVFTSSVRTNGTLETQIRDSLAETLGVDVQVIVKSAKDVSAIISGNKLGPIAIDPSRLIVAFPADLQVLTGLRAVEGLLAPHEQLHVGAYAAYLWCAGGISSSKAASAMLGKYGRGVTTRNWATVHKIGLLLGKAVT